MSFNTYLSSINYYLPEFVEHNIDLQNEFPGRVDMNLIEKIGVKSKHIISKNVKGSSLAYMAGEQLFKEGLVDKKDIDALIYCSVHHDYVTPATSCVLQHELGLGKNVMAFDITHGCSGYIYGLALAKSIIQTLGMKHVLFLTSSALTKYVDDINLSLRLLFGDAGSATIISGEKTDGSASIGDFVLGTNGAGFGKIIIKDGLEANPITETSVIPHKDQFGNQHTDKGMFMDGQSIFSFVIKNVPSLIEETLQKNNLTKEDITLYVLHQANQFTLETLRKKMNVAPEKFFYSMETTGNTVQATIPIALKEAAIQGKITKGSKVLIAGFGTGLSWGATVITY